MSPWYMIGTINHQPSRAVAAERLGEAAGVVRRTDHDWWAVMLSRTPSYPGQLPFELRPGEDPLAKPL